MEDVRRRNPNSNSALENQMALFKSLHSSRRRSKDGRPLINCHEEESKPDHCVKSKANQSWEQKVVSLSDPDVGIFFIHLDENMKVDNINLNDTTSSDGLTSLNDMDVNDTDTGMILEAVSQPTTRKIVSRAKPCRHFDKNDQIICHIPSHLCSPAEGARKPLTFEHCQQKVDTLLVSQPITKADSTKASRLTRNQSGTWTVSCKGPKTPSKATGTLPDAFTNETISAIDIRQNQCMLGKVHGAEEEQEDDRAKPLLKHLTTKNPSTAMSISSKATEDALLKPSGFSQKDRNNHSSSTSDTDNKVRRARRSHQTKDVVKTNVREKSRETCSAKKVPVLITAGATVNEDNNTYENMTGSSYVKKVKVNISSDPTNENKRVSPNGEPDREQSLPLAEDETKSSALMKEPAKRSFMVSPSIKESMTKIDDPSPTRYQNVPKSSLSSVKENHVEQDQLMCSPYAVVDLMSISRTLKEDSVSSKGYVNLVSVSRTLKEDHVSSRGYTNITRPQILRPVEDKGDLSIKNCYDKNGYLQPFKATDSMKEVGPNLDGYTYCTIPEKNLLPNRNMRNKETPSHSNSYNCCVM